MEKLLLKVAKETVQCHWTSKQRKNPKEDLLSNCCFCLHTKINYFLLLGSFRILAFLGSIRKKKKNEEKQHSKKDLNATTSSKPSMISGVVIWVWYYYIIFHLSLSFAWTSHTLLPRTALYMFKFPNCKGSIRQYV